MSEEPTPQDQAPQEPVPQQPALQESALDEPALVLRPAPNGRVWSAWAVLAGAPSEEIFEASCEQEAADWIATQGPVWLEQRRRRRSA